MLEVYYNSLQYRNTIRAAQQLFTRPIELYEALADFYEAGGYFKETPSRIYRYQVLLSFAEQYDGAHLPLYKELLTFDLYLRENAKSRPDFAGDREDIKGKLSDFYRREAEERRLLPDYEGYDGRQLARMTHLELFRYPVWQQEPGESPETGYVLFDYKNRNPLNREARIVVLKNLQI